MIEVKHRWMVNRNMVEGGVVFSFNHEGIARVQDLGNNRVAAEGLIRNSKGLIDWYDPSKVVEVTAEPAPKPVSEPKKKLVDPVKVLESKEPEKVEEPAEEVKKPEKVLEPEPTSEVSSKEKVEPKKTTKTPMKKASSKKKR